VESREYIRMTIDCLARFGIDVETDADLRKFTVRPQNYRPADYTVEGDWSSASYFLGLGALAGRITVRGLSRDSFQADRFMLNCLRSLNAETDVADDGSLTVSRSPLNGMEADLNESIDLLPTVACLCAAAKGHSALSGIGRARLKESDRVAAVTENLLRMGIPVIQEDYLMMMEGGQPHGAVIDSCGDHRIAMAFAMLASVCGDTVIEGAECVGKTYPGFWEDYRQAGGKVVLSE
jgi:3-phosphoshikimate 1-carboxyvinyltransferase